MAINVFTNVSSLNAQRNLNINSAAQSKTLQRLSSGMRINSASDDAAGLAISNGLTSQIKGFNQAIRNAGDGLSLLGTAEGAMVEQTGILQRMREIAVQAASDSNNSTNRSDLNGEASQLKAELERIARTTSFNGNNLLDGSFQAKDLQVGAMATGNDRITISFSSTKAADIGSGYTATSTVDETAALAQNALQITTAAGTFNVGAASDDGVSFASGANSALAKANAINAITSSTGVTATATTTVVGANQDTTANPGGGAGLLRAGDLKINNVDIGAVDMTGGDTTTTLRDAINAKQSETGVTASLNGEALTLTAADGRNITIEQVNANVATLTGLTGGTGGAAVTTGGDVTLRSTNTFSFNTNAAVGTTAASAALDSNNTVNSINLTSKSGAQTAIQIVDVALGQLNSRRAQIGALTNRLNTTINNLNSSSENASASNSRIVDTDFAQETASMQRGQILQQAGIAILAQANQGPQAALSLLR